MTRAFLAFRPPDPVLDALEAVATDARKTIRVGRWTRRDQWHLTIQFLGDQVEVGPVINALRTLDGRAAPMQLGGVGAFPRDRRAGVLWVGVVAGAEWIGALAREVGAQLASVGYAPEDRPFHPHVTIARLEPAQDLRGPIAGFDRPAVGPAWQPTELVLFASRTDADGARYEPLATFPLT